MRFGRLFWGTSSGSRNALDLLNKAVESDFWVCEGETPEFVSGGVLAASTLVALLGHQASNRLGLAIGQDLPFMIFTCLPMLLNVGFVYWITSARCLRFPEVPSVWQEVQWKLDALAEVPDSILKLTLLQCLMAACTLALASIHPIVAMLGAAGLSAAALSCSSLGSGDPKVGSQLWVAVGGLVRDVGPFKIQAWSS